MNKAQENAIKTFRRFLDYHEAARRTDRPEWQKEIVEFTVEETEHLLSITAKIDCPNLSEGNYLRFLESQYWLVFIGKRGGITAKMYPKSYDQFRAKQKVAFGINFK